MTKGTKSTSNLNKHKVCNLNNYEHKDDVNKLVIHGSSLLCTKTFLVSTSSFTKRTKMPKEMKGDRVLRLYSLQRWSLRKMTNPKLLIPQIQLKTRDLGFSVVAVTVSRPNNQPRHNLMKIKSQITHQKSGFIEILLMEE